MKSLTPPCLARKTAENYVLYPTLRCSACYKPSHASQHKNVFDSHQIFRQRVIVQFSSKLIFVLPIYLTLLYLV